MTVWTATTTTEDGLTVTAFADGERQYAWGLRASDVRLAARLTRAVEAGVMFTRNGDRWSVNVIGRHLNSGLKELGY